MIDFIFLSIIALIILGILFYLRQKSRTESKKDLYWKIIEITTIILITVILANEVVQPFFSPRVSDIEINPLFIQSVNPDANLENTEYYAVFGVKYKILTPLIGRDQKITLRIPGGSEERIEVIFSFQENNPYYSILEKEGIDGYVSSRKLNGELPIRIEANAYDIREIDVNFIIREEMDIIDRRMGISDRFWWTNTKIKPISSIRDIYATSHKQTVGYGLKSPLNIPFEFSVIKVENLADLEIRGLRLSVSGDTICLGDLEITKMYDKYISVELDPGEVKNLLLVTKKDGLNISTYYHSTNFKGREGSCAVYNQIYKKLLEEM